MPTRRHHDIQQERGRTLAAIDRLPLDPGPVMALMSSDVSDPDALIKALSTSPALAGRVIGVANSAASSALHRMDSIERCVRHLGGKQARTIALTMAMQMVVKDLDIDPEVIRPIWTAATAKAITAQLVADALSLELSGQAYTAGLLQDIALPIMLMLDPEFFDNHLAGTDGKAAWCKTERSRFGIDHAELGALLLKQWGVPEGIVDAVADHHAPLSDNDMAMIAQMPTRFAGLLPHVAERTTELQGKTLAAMHACFLSARYTRIEDLLAEVSRRVKAMGKAAGGTPKFGPDYVQDIAAAVAQDTFALAAQVRQLDQEIAKHVQQVAEARHDALSDPLTGLLNRRGFETFGEQLIAQAAKAELPVACLVIDFDDFKAINDAHGHAAGDTVLKTASELLKTNVASGDLVARMGGDEFIVLMIGDTEEDAHSLAQRLHMICNGRSVTVGVGKKAQISMSTGAVFLKRISANTSTQDLINAADQVMYGVKHGGKSGMKFEMYKRAA